MRNISLLFSALSFTHTNPFVSPEGKKITCLCILLTGRPNGTLQSVIYPKATWGGRYLLFSSFSSGASKRGLVQTRLHSGDNSHPRSNTKEEPKIWTKLANDYPETPIKQKGLTKSDHRRTEKVVIALPFRDDHFFNQINRNLEWVIRQTYLRAQLR